MMDSPSEIKEESRSGSPMLERIAIVPGSSPSEDDKTRSSPEKNKKIFYSWCLLFLPIILAICAIFSIVAYIASLPLLILSFLVARALQLFWHGDDFEKAVQLKLFIRSLMFIVTSWLAIVLAIFYGIAKQIPSFKQAVILKTPLENWIILLFVIYGIYMLHWVLLVCVYKFVPKIPLNRFERGLNVPESVLEIIDCLILLLALSEVEKRVPTFKGDKIYGLYTRKWVEVAIFDLLAYNVIVLCSRLVIANNVLPKFLKLFGIKGSPTQGTKKISYYDLIMQKIMRVRYVKYCAIGLKQSIDFILSSLVFLLTWVFYFRCHLEETPGAERVFKVGKISCVTLLVCAILWFVKTYLLLLWKVLTVYNRLESKIIEGARQLYYLGILGIRRHDIFNLRDEATKNDPNNEEGGYISFCLSLFPVWENKKMLPAEMRNIVQGDLFIKKGRILSFYGLQQIVYYFLEARETLKDDKYTCDIFDDIKELISEDLIITSSEQQNSSNTSSEQEIISDNGVRLIEQLKFKQRIKEDLLPKQEGSKDAPHRQDMDGGEPQESKEEEIFWLYFHEQMSEYVDSSAGRDKYYSLEQIENWMERARNHCLFLANTLASAKELVSCLNNLISGLLIAATFILWLLLTGFATTQVLVLFGSPFVAASFIFGDTFKTLFQGIIFVYVVHPFHVGDFCIIDDKMMEVRTIGIWRTTFSKVDTPDEVIYPNSELFTKKITNHKTNFDWYDHIELEVGSVNVKKTKTLKKSIENYFRESKKYVASLVVVSRAGSVTKIAVTYKSNKDMKTSTYSRCLKEKEKLKSELLDDLQDIVEQHEPADLPKSAAAGKS